MFEQIWEEYTGGLLSHEECYNKLVAAGLSMSAPDQEVQIIINHEEDPNLFLEVIVNEDNVIFKVAVDVDQAACFVAAGAEEV